MQDRSIRRYDILLPPFLELREEAEEIRALRARTEKRKRIKKTPVRFCSVNTMYPVNRRTGRKYLSKEGELWKDYIFDVCDKADEKATPLEDYYECSYIFYMLHEMIFTKGGELLERNDVTNFLKASEDGIFTYLDENDAQAVSVHGYKRLTVDVPKMVVLLSPADLLKDGIYHAGRYVDAYDFESDAGLLQEPL